MILGAILLVHVLSTSANVVSEVRFQAHRGGAAEYPENTIAAYRASWRLNALPEVDVRTTKDGVIICLHDDTLKRTSNAPASIRDKDVVTLTFDEVRSCDVGVRFDPAFAGQKVPSLEEVFAEMQGHPEREMYLDFKTVDLDKLGAMMRKYGVEKQVIYCHCDPETCRTMRTKVSGLRTMLWIGGKPDEIKAKFEKAAKEEFRGFDQVQLHLNKVEDGKPFEYALSAEFLKSALERTSAKGVDLEVLPWDFDDASLAALLDLGIRWYATDHPNRFRASVERWETSK